MRLRLDKIYMRVRRVAVLGVALLPASSGCGTADGQDGSAVESGAQRAVPAADSAIRALADRLLPEVETLSALPAREPLAVAVRTRGELEAFLTRQLAEQLPPEKLAGLQRAYVRLGLLPPDLELADLLRSLLLEQVVGYYDPARDTLYVMENVDPNLVEPVLAHEMVHALQDQYVDLDSLMKANENFNDRATAAQSALEGHATIAMLEWQLARLTGGSIGLESLPSLSSLPEDALMEAAGMEMPELAAAPRLIRESLVFPYIGGLEFVRARWRAEGGDRFAPLGDEMPVSSEQVLHPDRAFGKVRDEPVDLAFEDPIPQGWTEVHSDGLGELETRIWLREWLDDPVRAERGAEGWDGDLYRLVSGPEGDVLSWVTAWDSPDDAGEFSEAAREIAGKRYSGDSSRRIDVLDRIVSEVPLVILIDRPTPLSASGLDDGIVVRAAAVP